ncbi:MAG: non-canonical purine NTP pyrophosphatase [Gemmatimonadota bacterium]|nr:non-canonical purine NTP pyrophosphatase [Gemmatimonadota bacterium]
MNGVRYLVATRNPGKLRELRDIFMHQGIAVTDLTEAGVQETPDEESIESWDTFEENALAKAQYFYARTGLPTFADDSGLAVEALGGAPGVRSKRLSGRTDLSGRSLDAANNAALLSRLRKMDALPAVAAFVCAAAFASADRAVVRSGSAPGTVIKQPRGVGGFGYDSHFLSTDLGLTFAEASDNDKLEVGHRGRAFRALLTALGL